MATQNPTPYASSNPSMYTPPTMKPPTPTYAIPGTNERTTNPAQVIENAKQGNMTSVPGVGMVPQSTYGTHPSVMNPTQQDQQAQPSGQPSLQTPQVQAGQAEAIKNLEAPVSPTDPGAKYQAALPSMKGTAPNAASDGRLAVAEAVSKYQAPTDAYKPTPTFMQVGDPIMQQYMQAAMEAQQNVITSGHVARNLEAVLGKQLQDINLQAANIQNIMNGSRNDIQTEVQKAGGFITKSQLEEMVTSRNRDLLVQHNNIELQKQTMQNQMNMQVQLSKDDHQFAVDTFNNVTSQASLYKNIYTNAQDQFNKNVAARGIDNIVRDNQSSPETLRTFEKFLNVAPGTLDDPAAVAEMQANSYRERMLNLSQQRLNITIGNQIGTPDMNQQYAQMLADGTLAPSQLKRMGPQAYADILKRAGDIQGSPFDAEKADQQFAFGKSQSVQQTIVGLGFAKTTLQTLKTLSDKLDRGNITYGNKVGQWLSYSGSDPDTVDFITKANIAIDDVGAALGGGISTDAKLGIAAKIIDPTLSKEAFTGQIDQLISSVQARANEYVKQKGGKVSIGGILFPVGVDIFNGKTKLTVNADGTLTGSDGKLYNVGKDGSITPTK